MTRRREGSRLLDDDNIDVFFVPGIEELELDQVWISDFPFVSGTFECCYLRRAGLRGCRNLTDASLERIVAQNSQTLRELDIIGCGFHANGISKISLCSSLHVLYLSLPADMSCEQLAAAIRGCRDSLVKLKVLRIGARDVTPLLAELENAPNLLKLNIEADQLPPGAFLRFVKARQESLLALTLKITEFNCTPEMLRELETAFGAGRLERFVLHGAAVRHLEFLHGAKALKQLRVSGRKFTSDSIQRTFSSAPFLPSLRELHLSNMSHLVDETIAPILPHLTSLTSLALCDLRQFSASCLTALRCSDLIDLNLSAVDLCRLQPLDLPKLTYLNVANCELASTQLGRLLLRCTSIAHLVVMQNSFLNDEGLRSALISCPLLRSLEASKCIGLRAPRFVDLPHLASLDLSWTHLSRVTILSCPSLHTLDLSGCVNMPPSELVDALQDVGTHLGRLWLRCLPWLTDDVLDALASRRSLTALRALNITDCAQVTDRGLQALLRTLPLLTRLYLKRTSVSPALVEALEDKGIVPRGWHPKKRLKQAKK